MSGWRDFALRELFFAESGPAGRAASKNKEFADPATVSARTVKGEGQDADDQPADRKSARGAEVAQEGAGAAAVAAEARRVHARLHHDPEEAELGASQGRQGAPDQRVRGDRLYPGRGP